MGGGDETAAHSLYEIFFDLEENLCQRYTALTPFMVRREKVGEVFLLVQRINAKSNREKGVKRGDVVTRDKAGNIHIRRQAMRDDWY